MWKISRGSGLVLLVLAGIWKARDHSSNASSRGSFTGIDENQELHQIVIDLPTARLDNKDVLITDYCTALHERPRSLHAAVTTNKGYKQIVIPDSPIVTEVSWLEYLRTTHFPSSSPRRLYVPSFRPLGITQRGLTYLATWVANSGCEFPAKIFMELVIVMLRSLSLRKYQNFVKGSCREFVFCCP